MQHVTRLALTLLLTFTVSAAIGAKTDIKEAEYKRSDTNYYFKSDVLKADPGAVIIAKSDITQKGDSYFFTPKIKAPQTIYVQVENDWVEPITPPTMPTSLGVAPDEMQIREPQGDVTVALPNSPANFVAVTTNLTIPNGAVIKTGANGTAAVLMGGVDSIRLIPNSSAAVQQTVTPQLRTTEIDLTVGAIFSKVGKRIGEKQDYQVHTPFGVAAAKGTDFVTVVMPARVDVWIAQGTVQLDQLDGKTVGTVSSEGTGALKIIRNPAMPDAQASMMASAQTMTAAFNFIPTVNVYIKALDDKMAQGVKLTPTERDYLNRIKKVPCLIKLALVAPPAPPPAPVPPPAPPPAPKPAPAPEAATPTPAAPVAGKPAAGSIPVQIALGADGSTTLNGVPITSDAQLAGSLDGIAGKFPAQTVVLVAGDSVSRAHVLHIESICKDAKLTHIKRVKSAPASGTSPAAPAPESAPAAPEAKPKTAPVPLVPIDVDLRPDAKVDFQGATLTLDELKPKLVALGKATPTQPLNINVADKVPANELKKVVALCHSAKLTKLNVVKAPPAPAPATVATAPAPAPEPMPTPAPAPAPTPEPAAPAAPAPVLAPMEVGLLANGKVDFQGETLSLDDLKPKLDAIADANPAQPIVIKRKEKLEKGQVKKVVDLCHSTKLTKITVDKTPPSPAVSTPDAAPSTITPSTAPPAKPLPPALLLPINIDLRPDGKVDYQGATYALNDLKPKLQDLGKTTPLQPLVVTRQANVKKAEVKKVVALCHEAKLTKVTVAKAEPPTAPAVVTGATPAPSPATSSSTTEVVASPSPVTRHKIDTSSHAPLVSAPISTGPEYTVP